MLCNGRLLAEAADFAKLVGYYKSSSVRLLVKYQEQNSNKKTPINSQLLRPSSLCFQAQPFGKLYIHCQTEKV